MCGLIGLIGAPRWHRKIDDMIAAIKHRGPDSSGKLVTENMAFGHTRLSILDHSDDASQPMHSHDKSVVLIFNGEIYNWRAIRKEIAEKYPFASTTSDTETLLAAYHTFGPAAFSMLRGPFAIALYDITQGKVILARDAIGEKPIFYRHLEDGGTAFASEVKALGVVSDLAVSSDQVYAYLSFLSPSVGLSMFEGISKIRPGCLIEFDALTGMKIGEEREFWNAADVLNRMSDIDTDMLVARGMTVLSEAVDLQSRTDTDIAVALSGGLDSSLNLEFSKRSFDLHGQDRRLVALNITFDKADAKSDESNIARQFAKDRETPMLSITLSEDDFWEEFEFLSNSICDCPVIWPDMVLLSTMARRLKDEGIKVMLVGEGGDDLGAYGSYFSFLRNAREKRGFFWNGAPVSSRHIIGFSDSLLERHWILDLPSTKNIERLHDLQVQVTVSGEEGLFRQLLNIEYKQRLPELLLQRLDLATMLHGIEARAPFLDIDLVGHTLPTRFEVRNVDRNPKSWLKDLGRKVLPDYVTEWPKRGFGHEFNTIMNDGLWRKFTSEVLENPAAPVRKYLNDDFINYCDRAQRRRVNYGHRLWIIFTLNRWLAKFDPDVVT